jgi:hypothetical protein
MKINRLHTAGAWVTVVSILSACGAGDPESHTSETTERFSTAPSEPNHEDITRAGLSFLRPEILTALTLANASTDVQFALVNANHFDDCNFSGGSLVVSSSEADAVSNLNPALPPESEALAILSFGHALHAAQDFYAHSNWVELGGSALVDGSLTAFPTLTGYSSVPSSGFVVIQGPPPKKASLKREADEPYPRNAIVRYKAPRLKARGLISGTVDYEPGNDCPASVAMTHEELNKDKSTLAGRQAQYALAKALATSQTRHEWCRLSDLVRVAWGDAGTARLFAWVLPGAPLPDCLPQPVNSAQGWQDTQSSD